MLKFLHECYKPEQMRGKLWVFKYAVAPLKVHINDNVFGHF